MWAVFVIALLVITGCTAVPSSSLDLTRGYVEPFYPPYCWVQKPHAPNLPYDELWYPCGVIQNPGEEDPTKRHYH